MKGSYFGFGSPQQQVDMHARSKNTFIHFKHFSYNMHYSFNDKFFQTPPLRDAKWRWLVDFI